MASRFLLSAGLKRTSRSFGQLQRCFATYPPHEVMGMPSLSPTMESGTISVWNVKVGDSFSAGDSICSVETDKATVDFEAQDDGVVAKILREAGGGEIKCGEPILVTVEDPAHVPAFADFIPSGAPPPPASAPPATPEPPAASTTPTLAPAAPTPAATKPSGGKVIASPLAHMLAKELGHDIHAIVGTGPGGRIIAADVKEFVPMAESATAASTPAPGQAAMAAATASTSAPPPVHGAGYTDYALSDAARETAARLAQSKRNVPHYYLTVDIAMDELLKMRSTLNDSIGGNSEEDSIGVYELLLKATAAAMKAVPSANAAWMDSVVRVYDSVDINVVVGNGDSLYTPVISDVAGRGVKALSKDLKQAMEVVDGNLEAATDNFSAVGTITVMNLGMYGIKSCAPIIREPQACALALGTLENRIVPSEKEDELYKQSVMMTATMSLDHRVVDGAVGAQWLASFKSHVENPATLLL